MIVGGDNNWGAKTYEKYQLKSKDYINCTQPVFNNQ